MGRMDLHIHSHYSADADLSTHDILDISKKKGMKTISITDHNCVKGIEEAIQYGNHLNIEVIPGIEIDCTYKKVNLHLLGYYINWNKKEFKELEQDLYNQGMDAFPQMISNLNKIGIIVDEDEVLKKANGKIPCGELIGEVILSNANSSNNRLLIPYLKGGERSDMPYLNFYRDFFAQDKVAYVPSRYMHLKDAIDLIKKSNGIPVIAHPGENLKNSMDMIDHIIKEGVMGIEIFSNYHNSSQIDYFYKKAEEYKCLITCGSDFHGKNKPGIEIGSYNGRADEIYFELLRGRYIRAGMIAPMYTK